MDASGPIRFGIFEADLLTGELRKKGVRVKLQDQPFQILAALLEHPREIVTREELRRRLWPSDVVVDFDSGLNRAVNRLRDALGDDADNPRFIETLPQRGYRFFADVESAAVPPRASPPEAEPISTAPPGTTRRLWIAAAGAAAVVPLLTLGYRRVFSKPAGREPPVTVALLPFDNLTGDAGQEYFADGLTEETIAVLGRVNPNRMTVIARTSTMVYKRHPKTARQIGSELGADYLLEGSVRREGQKVRVTVKLIRVRDQSPVWSENYDRTGPGVIQIQDELGNAIARQIGVELLPGDTNQRPQTRILEAYESYLLGRHYWSQVTPGAIHKSIEYYQAAIAKDPSYALAFAGLADAYSVLPVATGAPPRDMRRLAGSAASEALRLNESLAEAQAAGGYVDFWLEWNWGRAAERLRRAIQLSPNSVLAHRYYAHVLSCAGRHTEAIAQITIARQLDPLSPLTNTMAGQFLFYARRHREALEVLDKAFSIDPDYWIAHLLMGHLYEQDGKGEAAIQRYDRAYGASGGNVTALAMKGYVLARNRRHTEAVQIVRTLVDRSKNHFVPPTNIALVYTGLGNRDSAFQWLNKGYEARDVGMVFLAVDPKWDGLRSDPRFQELLTRCRFGLSQ